MSAQDEAPLGAETLEEIRRAFHAGAERASVALQKWLGTSAVVSVDAVRQVPFVEAVDPTADCADLVLSCTMGMSGTLRGRLVFLFDEASGLALADLVLGRSGSRSGEWTDLEISAASETANIVGCCYLDALRDRLADDGTPCELLPSPPEFRRDFAESIVQSALAGQMLESDVVFLAGTKFVVSGTDLDWTFLFVPDAAAVRTLGLRCAPRRVRRDS